MGEYRGAEPLLRRALAITEKVLGPEHRDTVICRRGLVSLLQSMGDYAGAELLQQRVQQVDGEGSCMAKKDLEGMHLSAVVQAWMDEQGWQDEIEIGDNRSSSQVAVTVEIAGQPHRLFLGCNEKTERFSVFIYSTFNVPPGRRDGMARILNRVHRWSPFGRAAFDDDADASPVQFVCTIDVAGGSLTTKQVDTMYDWGTEFFEYWGSLLAAVAMTKRPEDELWNAFLVDKKAQMASGDGSSES